MKGFLLTLAICFACYAGGKVVGAVAPELADLGFFWGGMAFVLITRHYGL